MFLALCILSVLQSLTARGILAQQVLPAPPPVASPVGPPTEIAGLADMAPYAPMEFSRAWLGKMARVRRRRQELLAEGRLDGASPAELARLGAALAGQLHVLVVPIVYADRRTPFPISELAGRLFGPAHGDTVSYASYFEEVSGGLLHVDGSVTTWERTLHAAGYYLAPDEYGWGHFGRMRELRSEVLGELDASGSVDFGAFDNDGPDGIPNSGDDDGFVDFVVFLYAAPCRGDARAGAIWPHRGAMRPFVTHSPAARGGTIRIADYLILPAVDPRTCGPLEVGVLAHETGHALGLPDLYDYDGSSQGIGAWGLMGTGSHSVGYSPAHLGAWSLEQLGWAREDWLKADSARLSLPPVETSHRIWRYDLDDGSGKYILFENRERLGSDSYVPGTGLLAWHVDPERGELGAWNSDERMMAVGVVEADGLMQLERGRNANAGDPFPGATHRHRFELLDPQPFRLSSIEQIGDTIMTVMRRGFAAARLDPAFPVLRLRAAAGTRSVGGEVTVRRSVGAPERQWTAHGRAQWLHTASTGDLLVVHADAGELAAGDYADTLALELPGEPRVAGRMVVALDVAPATAPEIAATALPWSWGLAADSTRVLQASYGWDPLGLRPSPRVLQLRDGQPVPHTLARLPADAVYAPVLTPDGTTYVLARAGEHNYLYAVAPNGDAALVTDALGSAPAYGAAALPDGSILVAGWGGALRRVDPRTGAVRPWRRLSDRIYQIATDGAGTVFAATWMGEVLRITAPTGHIARIVTPFGRGGLVAVAATPAGDLFAAERGGGGRILRVDADGRRRVVLAVPGARFYGLAVAGGDLYALDLGHRELLRIPLDRLPVVLPPPSAGALVADGR